jgi:hypothetical protein
MHRLQSFKRDFDACLKLVSFVIPGRREATSPESITTIVSMDSGPAPSGASGMTKDRDRP